MTREEFAKRLRELENADKQARTTELLAMIDTIAALLPAGVVLIETGKPSRAKLAQTLEALADCIEQAIDEIENEDGERSLN